MTSISAIVERDHNRDLAVLLRGVIQRYWVAKSIHTSSIAEEQKKKPINCIRLQKNRSLSRQRPQLPTSHHWPKDHDEFENGWPQTGSDRIRRIKQEIQDLWMIGD